MIRRVAEYTVRDGELDEALAEVAHRAAPYTSAFVGALYPRCIEEPRFTELHAVTAGGTSTDSRSDASRLTR